MNRPRSSNCGSVDRSLEAAFSTCKLSIARASASTGGSGGRWHRSHAAAGVPQLAPGTYRVTWRAVSVDTHVSKGEFTFDVAP